MFCEVDLMTYTEHIEAVHAAAVATATAAAEAASLAHRSTPQKSLGKLNYDKFSLILILIVYLFLV
jgi:hypothetical protein